MLGLASIMGAPMRPEEVEEVMRNMNQPKIVHVLKDDNDSGSDPLGATSSEEPPADSRSH